MSDILEKAAPLGIVMPELVTKNPKGAWRVTEPAGDFVRLAAVDEEAPKSFVLPMERFFGARKKRASSDGVIALP